MFSNSKISKCPQLFAPSLFPIIGDYPFSSLHFKNRDKGSISVVRYVFILGRKYACLGLRRAHLCRSSHWGSRYRPYIGFFLFWFTATFPNLLFIIELSASTLEGVISHLSMTWLLRCMQWYVPFWDNISIWGSGIATSRYSFSIRQFSKLWGQFG